MGFSTQGGKDVTIALGDRVDWPVVAGVTFYVIKLARNFGKERQLRPV
jgi:hypothetical protein